MKKILGIVTIAAVLTSCGGGNTDTNITTAGGQDSIKRAFDSVQLTGDTSSMNKAIGDTTSASGGHGAGSGSSVGGGNTGGPQKKGGQ
ncbi:MAG: hypothetical protein M3040_09105 [Bacteroidota bacterium]|nr:hypothetical protein [Bacteroidota bacterium]